MSMIKKIATAGAVAVMGLGLGAASASAYSIDAIAPNTNPFPYVGTTSVDHSFTVGGFYTITCPAALTTFSGIATGADNTDFTPAYGGTDDCEFFGLPASVTQSGKWNVKVTGGSGPFTGEITIPSTSTTTIEVPLAACTVTVTGTQTFEDGVNGNVGTATNVVGGIELEALATNIIYSASAGCPFSSNNDGEYNTNGPVSIPGIEVN